MKTKKPLKNNNLDWLNKQKSMRYANEWVAIAEGKLIAHDEVPENILSRIEEASRSRSVTIMKIPPKNAVMFL